jgi:PleD family two-component response regulator
MQWSGLVTDRSRKPRILIVDDSSTYRLWLGMMLQDRYEVHMADDGDTGVSAALSVQPDLILMDVVMPRVDGLSACRVLRSHPETRRIPLILLSSVTDEWDVEAGYSSGCSDRLIKPVEQLELVAKVECWLRPAPAPEEPAAPRP